MLFRNDAAAQRVPVQSINSPFVYTSFITRNITVDLRSENANVILGIDVAGWSKEVTIKHNFINLNDAVGIDPDDEYIALRVRSNVDHKTVNETHNWLAQVSTVDLSGLSFAANAKNDHVVLNIL
jgi:hypothetical protein